MYACNLSLSGQHEVNQLSSSAYNDNCKHSASWTLEICTIGVGIKCIYRYIYIALKSLVISIKKSNCILLVYSLSLASKEVYCNEKGSKRKG